MRQDLPDAPATLSSVLAQLLARHGDCWRATDRGLVARHGKFGITEPDGIVRARFFGKLSKVPFKHKMRTFHISGQRNPVWRNSSATRVAKPGARTRTGGRDHLTN